MAPAGPADTKAFAFVIGWTATSPQSRGDQRLPSLSTYLKKKGSDVPDVLLGEEVCIACMLPFK